MNEVQHATHGAANLYHTEESDLHSNAVIRIRALDRIVALIAAARFAYTAHRIARHLILPNPDHEVSSSTAASSPSSCAIAIRCARLKLRRSSLR
jgi:hypothetical protein